MEISKDEKIKNIENFALRVRKNILEMAVSAGSSSAHFGGALSITENISTLASKQYFRSTFDSPSKTFRLL